MFPGNLLIYITATWWLLESERARCLFRSTRKARVTDCYLGVVGTRWNRSLYELHLNYDSSTLQYFSIRSVLKVRHACWGQSGSKRREKTNAIISQIVNVALEAALFSILSEEGQLGQRDCFASHRRSLGAVFLTRTRSPVCQWSVDHHGAEGRESRLKRTGTLWQCHSQAYKGKSFPEIE